MKIKKQEYEKLLKLGDQAFCSRLKRMTTHEDDAFFYVREDLFRILLEQGDPRASKISVAQKAKNLSGSMKKAASTPGGLLPVPKEVQEDRLATCGACELKHPKRWECKKCGCRLKAKTKLRGFECPVGKWGQWAEPERECEQAYKTVSDLKNYFDEVYCITLSRTPERWEAFKASLPKDWPFKEVIRYEGIDGKKVKTPKRWPGGVGAFGCYTSHVRIIESCINRKINRVLILEDDCRFIEGFSEQFLKSVQTLPKNWGQLYLGGEHLKQRLGVPEAVNDEWFTPFNVNRTHAYALQGAYMQRVYNHLYRLTSGHIDHRLGQLHQHRDGSVFTPAKWFAYQAAGVSQVSRKKVPDRVWKGAKEVAEKCARKIFPEDNVVVVLGVHSGGTSCTAGVLWAIGCEMGGDLGGRFGNSPGGRCGYEDLSLAGKLIRAVGWNAPKKLPDFAKSFKEWEESTPTKKGFPKALKHPLLCAFQEDLEKAFNPRLKYIIVDRPLEDSLRSMENRCQGSGYNLAIIKKHEEWLFELKENAANSKIPFLRVPYYGLLKDPVKWANTICEFLEIPFTDAAKEKVLRHVNPRMQNVGPRTEENPLTGRERRTRVMEKVKKAYPKKLPGPTEFLLWSIVRSRRNGGLTGEEFYAFDKAVKENQGLLLEWDARWIVSLLETYAESGEPAAMGISGFNMACKFHNTVSRSDGLSAASRGLDKVDQKKADIHRNYFNRLKKVASPNVVFLARVYLERQFEDSGSLLSSIDAWLKLPFQKQCKDIVK